MKNNLFNHNHAFVSMLITGIQRRYLSVKYYMQIRVQIVNML